MKNNSYPIRISGAEKNPRIKARLIKRESPYFEWKFLVPKWYWIHTHEKLVRLERTSIQNNKQTSPQKNKNNNNSKQTWL